MADPKDFAEYQAKSMANQRIDGFLAETTMHLPCLFCAAPDFMAVKVIEAEKAGTDGATCKECGRSAKVLFTRTPHGTSFEFVQTGGSDPAPWMPFKVRRV